MDVLAMSAKENSVDRVFVAGDLGHTDRWSAQLCSIIETGLLQLTQASISVYIMGGNHDEDKYGNWTISLLGHIKGVTTITAPLADKHFAYFPYCRNIVSVIEDVTDSKVFSDKQVAFFHHGFIGGTVGGEDWVLKGSVSSKRVRRAISPRYILSGHYHKPQLFKRDSLYIGSPRQHTFGEEGESKRFVIYDTGKANMTFVPTTQYFAEHKTLHMKAPEDIPVWGQGATTIQPIPIYRVMVEKKEWLPKVTKTWRDYKGRWSVVCNEAGIAYGGKPRSELRATDSAKQQVKKYAALKGKPDYADTGLSLVEKAGK